MQRLLFHKYYYIVLIVCYINSVMPPFGKKKKEISKLRAEVSKVTQERDEAKSKAENSERRERYARTQAEEQRKQSKQEVVSAQQESRLRVAEVEQDAIARIQQAEERVWEAYRIPSVPLVFFEDVHSVQEQRLAESTIDAVTQWQVEHIEAEATVRRELMRVGAEFRKAKLSGASEYDLQSFEHKMNSLVDELDDIRTQADSYEKDVVSEYSASKNALRVLDKMKGRVERGENLSVKEIEVLYERGVALQELLPYSEYRNLVSARDKRDLEKDIAVLYACDESQVTTEKGWGLKDLSYSRYLNAKHPFSGNILHHEGPLKVESYLISGDEGYNLFFANRLRFPEVVHGPVSLFSADEFKKGIDFPIRVEGFLVVRNVDGYLDSIFPEYVKGDCTIEHKGVSSGQSGPFLGEVLQLSEYVGGNLSLPGFTAVNNVDFSKYIEGDLALPHLRTAEGFVCPEHIQGRLILPTLLEGDPYLHIPESVTVRWV